MKRSVAQPDHGWAWIVVIATFLCQLIISGILCSFGIFFVEFRHYFQQNRGVISWISSANTGAYHLTGPLASVIANRFGCRITTILGTIVATLGLFLCPFSPKVEMMIFAYGVMTGFGFGLINLCTYIMIGHYFKKRRALATGMATCGFGIGAFLMPPLSVILIKTYAWQGAMWLLAGITLNTAVYGSLYRPFKTKENDFNKGNKPLLMDWSLFKNLSFLIITLSQFLCLIGSYIPFVFLPDFSESIGIEKGKAAWLLSTMGITNTIGRIVFGWISDMPWASAFKIYFFALLLGGGVTMCCTWLINFYLLCVYAAIYGACYAAIFGQCPIVQIEFLGIEKFSNSFGLGHMFRGIATLIGTPLAGFLVDVTGSHRVTFLVAGAAMCAGGLVCLPLMVSTSHANETIGHNQQAALKTTISDSGKL